MDTWIKQAISEAAGVFALVFVGAGAIMVDALTGGSVGLVGIAFAHGLAIAVMVTAVGHISGGHLNPAVTVAMAATRKMEAKLAGIYVIAQLIGGVLAALLLSAAFASVPTTGLEGGALAAFESYGTPALGNGISATGAILVELVLTFLLVYVIFGTVDERNPARIGGLAIGLTVTLDILMGGPLTGAAMNPARWFGPAVLASSWDNWYVWWVGPIIGGLLAGFLYDTAQAEDA